MANLSYIIPGINTSKFTIEYVAYIIQALNPTLTVQISNGKDSCIVREGNEMICGFYEHFKCPLPIDGELEHIKNRECFGVTRGYGTDEIRSRILTQLSRIFKAYWLDEGIHPEYIRYDDQHLNKYLQYKQRSFFDRIFKK